jgi:hypothetical protein
MFILRAFNGLRCYVDRLGTKIDWPATLAPYLEQHREALARVPG